MCVSCVLLRVCVVVLGLLCVFVVFAVFVVCVVRVVWCDDNFIIISKTKKSFVTSLRSNCLGWCWANAQERC